ncbi:MAG TPA: hypothetical protein DDY43_12875 [Synechococcales bacterium UBA10510]|nr:hypothetical protein [Synechococcales bacterium UBA10510]
MCQRPALGRWLALRLRAAGLPLSPIPPAAQAAAQPRLRHPPSWAGINHQLGSINPAHSQPTRSNDIARSLENKKPRDISGREATIDINGSRPAV